MGVQPCPSRRNKNLEIRPNNCIGAKVKRGNKSEQNKQLRTIKKQGELVRRGRERDRACEREKREREEQQQNQEREKR